MQQLFATIALFFTLNVVADPGPAQEISGKIYFSNQPMLNSNAGSKNVFSSAEYIYARLEVNGTTIKDVFRFKEPGKGYAFLQCHVILIKDGYEFGGSGRNYLLIRGDERNKS